jgi:hypothetical protein
VSKLHAFDVTEPRDAIYALLALAKNTLPAYEDPDEVYQKVPAGAYLKYWARYLARKRYRVDYGQSYVDTCRQFIAFCIDNSDPTRALDIICRPWAPAPKPPKGPRSPHHIEVEKMPSWIPQLSEAAHAMLVHPNSGPRIARKNADSLVGLPNIQRNYSAAGTTSIKIDTSRFKKRQSYYSMYVSGFVIDEVASTEIASQNGYIPEEWVKAAGWDNLEEEPPNEFWRTLVADRGSDGGNAPIYGPRAFQLSVTKSSSGGYFNTTELINEGQSFIISEFFRRVQAVIWNRRLVRTEYGKLGIVRKDVQPGDLVCILYGCSVPVILRRYKHDLDDLVQELEAEERDIDESRELIVIGMQRRWRELLSRRMNRQESINRIEKQRTISSINHEPSNVGTNGKEPQLKPRPAEEPEDMLKRNARKASPEERAKALLDLGGNECYYYEFLGECYVHGMMDGEGFRFQNEYGFKSRIFELR